MRQSLCLQPNAGLLGTWLTLAVHYLLLNNPVLQFSSAKNANQYCEFLRTVLDKHAPTSLRNAMYHNSLPCFQ